MIRVVCEWDINHENVVFSNMDKAMEWCRTNRYLLEIIEEDEDADDIEDLINEGLLDFEVLKVDP